MNNKNNEFKNTLVLLMGFPGVGKRTIGDVLARKMPARFSDHHCVVDPIMKLFGDDYEAQWTYTAEMWEKINEALEVYLSTISDVCAIDDNFIITEMMFDKDPYHQIYYKKVLNVAKKRNAHFFPIRLICLEDELIKRVTSEDRKKYLKTRDAELSQKRSRELEVFYTHHKNEITIDNTDLSPDDVADKIIEHIKIRK